MDTREWVRISGIFIAQLLWSEASDSGFFSGIEYSVDALGINSDLSLSSRRDDVRYNLQGVFSGFQEMKGILSSDFL